MDRLEVLQKFVATQPDDPFPRYGLAMEYKNRGRTDDALATFAELVSSFPDYVATYLMYGNVLAAEGRPDEARSTYQQGIEVAARAGDGHTKSELEAALASLS